MDCLKLVLRCFSWKKKPLSLPGDDSLRSLSSANNALAPQRSSGHAVSPVHDNISKPSGTQKSHVDMEIDLPLPRESSRIFALLVGIGEYYKLPKLTGPVNDARAMEDFLKSSMNVPADRIRLLLDHDAARHNIIDALKQLSEEDSIEIDDPILIYYAGHGTEMKPPRGWEAGGPGRKIQGICPCDYEQGSIRAIPDRTLGALIDLICRQKGNNITVIFDCCHSASGTRANALTTDIRGVVLDDDNLPIDLDRDLLPISADRGLQTITTFGVRGLGSHVLVAACKETKKAKEEYGRGNFTVALLDLLQEKRKLHTLTYTDIVKNMRPIPSQNPQVEGIHRDRVIFSAKSVNHRPIYAVHFKIQNSSYILSAGSVHGITLNSQFTIYKDHDSLLQSLPLGILLVSRVMTSTSVLRAGEGAHILDLEMPGIAIQSGSGADQALAIKISFELNEISPDSMQAIRQLENRQVVRGVNQEAQVEIQVEDGNFVFNSLHPTVNACGLNRLHHSSTVGVTTDSLIRILTAASSFFWHLERGHYHPMVKSINIKFHELTQSEDRFDAAGRPEIVPNEEDLLRNDLINLYIGSNPKGYGIKITNNSDWDLFPAAFYFYHSDWSVDTYYHPGTAGQFDDEAPLQKNGGTLTIGYGSGGSDPIAFRLNSEDQDVDVGHLKIFFSTKPVDLRYIEQSSPFTETRGIYRLPPPDLNTWVAVQYPIVQRRT